MREELIGSLDRKVLELSGFRAKRGWGTRPCLFIVDAQKKFVGINKPILSSMEEYPVSIGEAACKAVDNIALLLEKSRAKGIPVLYSTSGRAANEALFDSFARKRAEAVATTSRPTPADGNLIVPQLSPRESETVIAKRYASPFFGTPLMSFLNSLRVDTIIVTGFVTSGCIRAFAVDAASYNFNTCVVEEGTADRFIFAHDFTLLDLDIKYCDVVNMEEALNYLNSLS